MNRPAHFAVLLAIIVVASLGVPAVSASVQEDVDALVVAFATAETVFKELLETETVRMSGLQVPWRIQLVGLPVASASASLDGQVYVSIGMLPLLGSDKALWAALRTIYGLDAWVINFEEDRLVRGRYVVAAGQDARGVAIDDYNRVTAGLRQKLGRPAEAAQVWESEASRSSDLLKAVSRGDLTFVSRWETEASRVVVNLFGLDGKPQLIVEYRRKDQANSF